LAPRADVSQCDETLENIFTFPPPAALMQKGHFGRLPHHQNVLMTMIATFIGCEGTPIYVVQG
jgi:hypothetical protein